MVNFSNKKYSFKIEIYILIEVLMIAYFNLKSTL